MKSDRYADEQLNIEEYEHIADGVTSEDSLETATETPKATVEADKSEANEVNEVKEKKRLFGRKSKPSETDTQSLADIDLAKMKKKDLLEIMLAQSKEIDSLREIVNDLEAQLANREFEFDKIGSIAEASLAVTNIFKDAEEAAMIYLENIRRSYEKRSKHSDD